MVISAITAQKKSQSRKNIFLEGLFAFSLDLEIILKHHLHAGKELSDDEVNKLIKEHEFARWYNQSLSFLSFRPRSQKEIVDYLQKHEVGTQTVQLVIEKLVRLKLLDDHAFAQWFMESRQKSRPRSRRMLTQELRQKGIAPETMDEILTAAAPEIEQARKLAQKKIPRWAKYSKPIQKQKLGAYLGRLGFGWDIVSVIFKDFDFN